MTKLSTVIDGAVTYAERELLPKLNSLHRFAAAVYIGMLKADTERTAAAITHHPLLLIPGFSTDDGYIDLDKIYNVTRDYVARTPVEITVAKINVTLRLPDIDQMYAYIKESDNER